MLTSDKYNVRALVQLLVAHNVRRAVVSPGSRNAPIIVALAREAAIDKSVVIDERSAGFIALGMAVQTQSAVALVCTSGSAVLNYAPAIAEAYYREVPLIVISADRPKQWIDQDDSQTIRQYEILQKIVKRSVDIDVDSSNQTIARMAVRDINDALIDAVSGRQGPVHINIRLDVPLGGLAEMNANNLKISAITPRQALPMDEVRAIADELQGKKVLVVGGFMPPDKTLSRALARMASLPSFAVMHEAQSNVHGRNMIGQIDRTLSNLSAQERIEMMPDVVITFGGALVSRFIKAWLRSAVGSIEHWHVGIRGQSVDCFNSLTRRIELTPKIFMPLLAAACSKRSLDSDYNARWKKIHKRATNRAEIYTARAPWSDLTAMAEIMKSVPAKCNLQLSNGTAVRYAQLFDFAHIHRIDSNRGVSGIDGSTSTALGASACYAHPTLLISGDMSAQYDIAALSSELISPRFKMAVLNNGGGGIFRFIDSTRKLEELDRYLACKVNLPLEKLAEAYGLAYFRADSLESLRIVFLRFMAEQDRPAILDIVTDGQISASTLTDYFKHQQQHDIS